MSDRTQVATLEGEPVLAAFPMYATLFGVGCVIISEARYAALIERERAAELRAQAASASYREAPPDRQREAMARVELVQEVERLAQRVGLAAAVATVAQQHGIAPQTVRRYRARVAGRSEEEWLSALLTRKGPAAGEG